MLAGLDGGDATQGVVALATGTLYPPAGVAYEEQKGRGSGGFPTPDPSPLASPSGVCPELSQGDRRVSPGWAPSSRGLSPTCRGRGQGGAVLMG